MLFELIHPVCSLAREVTKWNKACDKRLYRLVSYLHSTRTLSQEGYVGDAAEDLSILCCTGASFAGDVQTSRSTSGCYICLVGKTAFMPLNAISKKQTVVSHSSTESEIVALDTALRVEGLPVLGFWDVVADVFGPCLNPRGRKRSRSTEKRRKDPIGGFWCSVEGNQCVDP